MKKRVNYSRIILFVLAGLLELAAFVGMFSLKPETIDPGSAVSFFFGWTYWGGLLGIILLFYMTNQAAKSPRFLQIMAGNSLKPLKRALLLLSTVAIGVDLVDNIAPIVPFIGALRFLEGTIENPATMNLLYIMELILVIDLALEMSSRELGNSNSALCLPLVMNLMQFFLVLLVFRNSMQLLFFFIASPGGASRAAMIGRIGLIVMHVAIAYCLTYGVRVDITPQTVVNKLDLPMSSAIQEHLDQESDYAKYRTSMVYIVAAASLAIASVLNNFAALLARLFGAPPPQIVKLTALTDNTATRERVRILTVLSVLIPGILVFMLMDPTADINNFVVFAQAGFLTFVLVKPQESDDRAGQAPVIDVVLLALGTIFFFFILPARFGIYVVDVVTPLLLSVAPITAVMAYIEHRNWDVIVRPTATLNVADAYRALTMLMGVFVAVVVSMGLLIFAVSPWGIVFNGLFIIGVAWFARKRYHIGLRESAKKLRQQWEQSAPEKVGEMESEHPDIGALWR